MYDDLVELSNVNKHGGAAFAAFAKMGSAFKGAKMGSMFRGFGRGAKRSFSNSLMRGNQRLNTQLQQNPEGTLKGVGASFSSTMVCIVCLSILALCWMYVIPIFFPKKEVDGKGSKK